MPSPLSEQQLLEREGRGGIDKVSTAVLSHPQHLVKRTFLEYVSRSLQPAVILVYCNTDFLEVLIHTGRADQGRAVRSWARGWDPLGVLRVSEGPSSAPLPPLPGAGSSGMWRSLPAQCRERAPACLSQGSPQLCGAAWSPFLSSVCNMIVSLFPGESSTKGK